MRRTTRLGDQVDKLLAAGVVLAVQERLDPLGGERAGVLGAGVALEERERDAAVQIAKALKRPIGPGQKRSSLARSWLASATLLWTRFSRARVAPAAPLV